MVSEVDNRTETPGMPASPAAGTDSGAQGSDTASNESPSNAESSPAPSRAKLADLPSQGSSKSLQSVPSTPSIVSTEPSLPPLQTRESYLVDMVLNLLTDDECVATSWVRPSLEDATEIFVVVTRHVFAACDVDRTNGTSSLRWMRDLKEIHRCLLHKSDPQILYVATLRQVHAAESEADEKALDRRTDLEFYRFIFASESKRHMFELALEYSARMRWQMDVEEHCKDDENEVFQCYVDCNRLKKSGAPRRCVLCLTTKRVLTVKSATHHNRVRVELKDRWCFDLDSIAEVFVFEREPLALALYTNDNHHTFQFVSADEISYFVADLRRVYYESTRRELSVQVHRFPLEVARAHVLLQSLPKSRLPDAEPLHSGVYFKLGSGSDIWQKRAFVFTEMGLWYFKKETEAVPGREGKFVLIEDMNCRILKNYEVSRMSVGRMAAGKVSMGHESILEITSSECIIFVSSEIEGQLEGWYDSYLSAKQKAAGAEAAPIDSNVTLSYLDQPSAAPKRSRYRRIVGKIFGKS